MLGAYAHGRHQIDTEIIEKSAREVFGSSESSAPDRSIVGTTAGLALVAAAGLGLIVLVGFAAYGGYRYFGPPVAAAPAARAAEARVAAAASLPSSSSPAAARGASAADSATASEASSPSRTASALAATAATSEPAASLPAIDTVAALKSQLKSLGSDEASAWRALAPMWKLTLDGGDPCAAASRQQVRCFKFASTLALLRSLDRPGFLTLHDDGGKPVEVVLVGLGDDEATLLAGGEARRVSIAALSKLWRGEFGTLWRLPPGYTTAVSEGASGPVVDRLAAQLASLAGEAPPAGKQTLDAALRAKVVRFQTSHGLSGVGKAGPTTFMQLNRASHVDEPTLLGAAAAR
jgi:general secretion pathway protein A